jgi:hypothetical protein
MKKAFSFKIKTTILWSTIKKNLLKIKLIKNLLKIYVLIISKESFGPMNTWLEVLSVGNGLLNTTILLSPVIYCNLLLIMMNPILQLKVDNILL